ncbi:uncharacterized protein LOC135205173 [Macrobrachium nipponense]|uniref:uncharacterized protein LOC135205173 n=1 Tax=Macrobrachium nipponense TaxID=159736 RepID=UPI0030C7A1B9
MVCFICGHNLPFTIVDHVVNLCKAMFPDSDIAQAMCMKKTKCTELTKVLGMCMTNDLASRLRENKVSLIIDESTDISTMKCLTIVVKFFHKDMKTFKTGTLQLINMYDENDEMVGSTGENLFRLIMNTLQSYNIPLENFVGFAADGAANIMGGNNSISSSFREEFPGIAIFKCICHSVHLCASEAVKYLPRHCEDLVRNIYTHFAHSAKRKHELKLAQTFLDLKPHKILHPCATRWLSLHAAVERVVEQWSALKLYFSKIEAQQRLKSIEFIVQNLRDPSVFLYLNFLNFILPKFSRLNLMFQQDAPTIHLLHEHIIQLCKTLLRYFCCSDVVDKVDLVAFDPSLAVNHMPLHHIYLGSEVHGLLQMDEYT